MVKITIKLMSGVDMADEMALCVNALNIRKLLNS